MPRESANLTEEQKALLTFLIALRLDRVREFLGGHQVARYGDRTELRERLQESLAAGTIQLVDVVDFLDEVEPWGKQHVFLYDGSDGLVEGWQDTDALSRRLGRAHVRELLNARLPLMLPEELTLSSIRVENSRYVTIAAVERRESSQRVPGQDRVEIDDAGQRVELRAYVRSVTRGLLIFRWDLLTNTASLHITQGDRPYDYQEAERRFSAIVQPFLAFDRFPRCDLHKVIAKIHALERSGKPEARSHRLSYRSRGGRTIQAASPTYRDSVTGETGIDDALTAIAGKSTGRLGNFYWLAGVSPTLTPNPLFEDLHMIVLANDSRINFMVPSSREYITYVLHRIRALI
jgi:hypothetical protein